jgi:hypothetical protein
MSKIELRLSNIDPPLPDPPRTIYRDIVNLPDPVKLGLTIRYFNYDDVALYFQITGSAPGYTFGTVNLGQLASGANAFINLDEFASRAKPSPSDLPNGEKEENITLILKAYTDSGYTNLKWTYERVVTVHWINSADPSFTVGVLNNFDDGTLQGWTAVHEYGLNASGYPTAEVATDYVLSTPYSCKMTMRQVTGPTDRRLRDRLSKSFTTPNKDIIYAIADIRLGKVEYSTEYMTRLKNLQIQRDGNVLVFIGRPYDTVVADYVPLNKWIRIVVPLPKNTTIDFRIVLEVYMYTYAAGYNIAYLWLDDFKIISK